MSCFAEIIEQLKKSNFTLDKRDKRTSKILVHSGLDFDCNDNTYSALLKVTDYIACMTDSYAVHQYQLISGIRYR